MKKLSKSSFGYYKFIGTVVGVDINTSRLSLLNDFKALLDKLKIMSKKLTILLLDDISI